MQVDVLFLLGLGGAAGAQPGVQSAHHGSDVAAVHGREEILHPAFCKMSLTFTGTTYTFKTVCWFCFTLKT